MRNRSGIALTVAIVVILMMTALAGFIYAPDPGGNPANAKYGPGAISSLAFNVFKSSYKLSSGRTLAYYRARAALVDAQERIRNNYTLLSSSHVLGSAFTSTASKEYNFKMSTGNTLTNTPSPSLEWVNVKIGVADPSTINISSSTNASPIQITTVIAHGMNTGDTATIASHSVNTNANGSWTITKVDATRFTLNGSTGNGIGAGTGNVATPRVGVRRITITAPDAADGT